MMKNAQIFLLYSIDSSRVSGCFVLQTDDIVLLADGKPPKTFDDIEGKMRENGEVTLQVLRQGRVEKNPVKTSGTLFRRDTSRVVHGDIVTRCSL